MFLKIVPFKKYNNISQKKNNTKKTVLHNIIFTI